MFYDAGVQVGVIVFGGGMNWRTYHDEAVRSGKICIIHSEHVRIYEKKRSGKN